MKNKGYILLHRKINDCILWDDPEPFCKRAAWIDLIMLANHADNQMRDKYGQVRTIHRGQCVVSIRNLADRWHWSPSTVQRYIKSLQDMGMVYAWGYKFGTLITLVNYDKYQSPTQGDTQSDTPKRRFSKKSDTPKTTQSDTPGEAGNADGTRAARKRRPAGGTPNTAQNETQTSTQADTQTSTKQRSIKNDLKNGKRNTAAAGDFSFTAEGTIKPQGVKDWEQQTGQKAFWAAGTWAAPGNVMWVEDHWAPNSDIFDEAKVVYFNGRWINENTGILWNGSYWGDDTSSAEPEERDWANATEGQRRAWAAEDGETMRQLWSRYKGDY